VIEELRSAIVDFAAFFRQAMAGVRGGFLGVLGFAP
jgi:hypothetical protein